MEQLTPPAAPLCAWRLKVDRPGSAQGTLRFQQTVWGLEVFVEEISQVTPVVYIDLFPLAHDERRCLLTVDNPFTGDSVLTVQHQPNEAAVCVISLANNLSPAGPLEPWTFHLEKPKEPA